MTSPPTKLLVATNNQGKIRELARLLIESPVELIGLDDLPHWQEVAETGASFCENAILKASGYAKQSGMCSLADDSGLEVDALGGRPGVHSARYGGAAATYDQKIAQLLSEVAASGSSDRTARFVCAMAVSDKNGEILFETQGICEGSLAFSPAGNNGFGYDPIFVPRGFQQTFGELDDDIKQQISHRAQASREIIRYLLGFMDI